MRALAASSLALALVVACARRDDGASRDVVIPAQPKVTEAPPPRPARPAEVSDAGVAIAADAGALDQIRAELRVSSPTERIMTRRAVDRILEDQAELFANARVFPEVVNGKALGLRVFGVRPDELLALLGFENGDRIDTIQGRPITSAEEALEAYAAARAARTIDVGVTRKGQLVHLVYRVEP